MDAEYGFEMKVTRHIWVEMIESVKINIEKLQRGLLLIKVNHYQLK